MTKTVIGTPASAHVTETTHVPQRTQDESARNRRQRHLCADNARTPTDVVIGTSLLGLQSGKRLLRFQSSVGAFHLICLIKLQFKELACLLVFLTDQMNEHSLSKGEQAFYV